MSIEVDIAEPKYIVELIQQSAEVNVLPLNVEGFADYCFVSADGVSISIEREGVSACLSDAPRIEDEIRRHLQAEGRMLLIIEGVALPNPAGTAICELVGTYLKVKWLSKTYYEALVSWIWQLESNKIDVIQTMNWQQSAIAIVSIYNNCQKTEHKTFKRNFQGLTSWHPNPLVQSLMGIVGAGLGEKKASILAEHYDSLQAVINAPREELLPLLGNAATAKFLKAIGR